MSDVLAPVAGLVRPLADVPDPVFAAEWRTAFGG